jgi:uncharacterized OB-fold protein
MSTLPSKQKETLGGFVIHGVPFPVETDKESLKFLKNLSPIQIEQEYKIVYLHSYAQDSPWFAGLTNHRLLGVQDQTSGYTYATPRGHDIYTGEPLEWIDITDRKAYIHAFTVCYFGSEEFLPDTPFVLALIEFEKVETLLLTRVLGVDPQNPEIEWIGMQVEAKFIRNSKLKPTDVYFVPIIS